jgi:hypothetical protein
VSTDPRADVVAEVLSTYLPAGHDDWKAVLAKKITAALDTHAFRAELERDAIPVPLLDTLNADLTERMTRHVTGLDEFHPDTTHNPEAV